MPVAILESDLRDRIRTAVRASKKPITFKALQKLTKSGNESLRAELESAVAEKQLYRWPDFRRAQYFWHLSPELRAEEAILEAVTQQALPRSELVNAAKKNLQGFSGKRVESVVSTLVGEKKLQAVPGFAGNSKLLVRPGDQDAYLNAARSFVENKVRSAGFDPAGLFAAGTDSEVKSAGSEVDAGALILEAVQQLEPVRGVPVSTSRLRSHLPNLSKPEFDRAALDLREREEVFLSQHVDSHNISPEEKDLLIDGQDGTYYVAVALR